MLIVNRYQRRIFQYFFLFSKRTRFIWNCSNAFGTHKMNSMIVYWTWIAFNSLFIINDWLKWKTNSVEIALMTQWESVQKYLLNILFTFILFNKKNIAFVPIKVQSNLVLPFLCSGQTKPSFPFNKWTKRFITVWPWWNGNGFKRFSKTINSTKKM